MPQPQIAPYGAWKSPITSDLIVAESIRLSGGLYDGDSIYWLEGRPAEGGRNVLVRCTPDGQRQDITPPPFNVRTRVHEYGGGAVIVDQGTVYFINFADQRFYKVMPGAEPIPITPKASLRYADGIIDHAHRRIICVREDHGAAGEAVNTITALSLEDDQAQTVLVAGNDFYATPRLSPDGERLAWLTWHHPNMPWDGTELWLADVQADGTLTNARCIAGGDKESIFQPAWSPDGVLYFVSDRTGWWNLYRWQDEVAHPMLPMEAEFGAPQWVFGMSTYDFVSPESLVCSYIQHGSSHLAMLNTQKQDITAITTPYTSLGSVRARRGHVLFRGGAPTLPGALIELDLQTQAHRVLKRSNSLDIATTYLSIGQAIEFPTENGLSAHGFFYPPHNPDYVAPEEEKPPLLVISHGGPTGASDNALSLGIQYWTSRGFAVLDVNYGGSTGYGRAYRERLNEQWGVVDVDDCCNGARYLVRQGLVDGTRLAIRGGSAGGYTTLCALTFRNTFHAGASHYGVGDLQGLTEETHKFESRYLDNIVGPYPAQRAIYHARSPIHHIDQLNCPVIFFQGLEDKVVPPKQAEAMVTALQRKGIPVAYLPFEGEQHGFRRAENIKRALDAELYFYARIFNFPLTTPVEPVPIANLSS